MTSFDTILIANRGEIAVRIIRTARALGFRTVAVYSAADRGMPHTLAADFAVPIGEAAANKSYLDISRIIAAARQSGAQAIHPGYGFLSESDVFAATCHAEGLTFIGPSADAIRAMANKAEAKRIMRQHDVPCIPGYAGGDQSQDRLVTEAGQIGFPVMIKATAGGGGKGMRLVQSATEMADALRLARSEALKAFGSEDVMLEKAVIAPRHVEVQVFGDRYGNVVHIGDRDCSIQRRHQKIIEEAPAPKLTDHLRSAMASAAVKAAKAVDYCGAGTVEFLVAGDAFYFLEMNTRLQVEHPVTEMVTGLDLVEWQIRVAAGEALPLRQDDIRVRGHAIEARLYAEDPASGFLPQSGTLLAWRPPLHDGLRIDQGLAQGSTVSTYYDPMLAKLIGYGRDREEARKHLLQGIEDFFVAGIKTNQGFLRDCIDADAFIGADLSTSYLDGKLDGSAPGVDPVAICLGAVLMFDRAASTYAPMFRAWRSRPWDHETVELDIDGVPAVVALRPQSPTEYQATYDARTVRIAVIDRSDRARVSIDGIEQTVAIAWDGDALWLSRQCETLCLRQRELAAVAGGGHGETVAIAPMPGLVASVRVEIGQAVKKGDVVVILEAMKMELPVLAPSDGVISAIHARAGDQVAMRQPLVEIGPSD